MVKVTDFTLKCLIVLCHASQTCLCGIAHKASLLFFCIGATLVSSQSMLTAVRTAVELTGNGKASMSHLYDTHC